MSTFQQELIQSLMTSPTVFEMFKRNNKKYMPYINTYTKKLFPETTEKVLISKKLVQVDKPNDSIIKLLDNISQKSCEKIDESISSITYQEFYNMIDTDNNIKLKVTLDSNKIYICQNRIRFAQRFDELKLKSPVCVKFMFTSDNVRYSDPFDRNNILKTYDIFLDLFSRSNGVLNFLRRENAVTNELVLCNVNELSFEDFYKLFLQVKLVLSIFCKEEYIYKTVKKPMNIGVEIEFYQKRFHRRICQQTKYAKSEKQKLQHKKGISSFMSGFDGNMTSRLNENRIRLNGRKGLHGFYDVLHNMRQNVYLTENSSVHMHFDHRFNNSYPKEYAMMDIRNKYGIHAADQQRDGILLCLPLIHKVQKDPAVHQILNQFFRIKDNADWCLGSLDNRFNNSGVFKTLEDKAHLVEGTTITKIAGMFNHLHDDRPTDLIDVGLLFGHIKRHNEFQTLEYRMFEPTLDFSTLVMQMLLIIQMERSITYKMPLNANVIDNIICAYKAIKAKD